MKNKKIPLRQCIVTRERLPKNELIRIVKFNDEVSIDLTGKQNGKGCYLKKDIDVIKKAQKTKALNKVFEKDIDEGIYDELLKIIS